MKRDDLTGRRYGRLTVVAYDHTNNSGNAHWLCRCDCGAETIVEGYNLRSGRVKSCGCYRTEQVTNRFRTHGHRYERIYRIWLSMKARCKNPNNRYYKDYGGRGVYICDAWDNDFQKFYDWSNDNGYREDLTIDRIDNDGPYDPYNCRWVTPREQANNRRSNRLLTYSGKTQTMMQWSEEINISYSTLRRRVSNDNLTDEEILSMPVKTIKPRYITYAGETHRLREWARILNVKHGTLRDHLNQGNFKDFEDYFGDL